jgi:hypothetical protein
MLIKIIIIIIIIALGLMQPTHVQTLRLRFSMLNHNYLISAFLTGRHLLRQLLAVLLGLNYAKMVREFGMVDDYDMEPVHPVYDYPL